jgi:hypothetical protein
MKQPEDIEMILKKIKIHSAFFCLLCFASSGYSLSPKHKFSFSPPLAVGAVAMTVGVIGLALSALRMKSVLSEADDWKNNHLCCERPANGVACCNATACHASPSFPTKDFNGNTMRCIDTRSANQSTCWPNLDCTYNGEKLVTGQPAHVRSSNKMLAPVFGLAISSAVIFVVSVHARIIFSSSWIEPSNLAVISDV